MGKKILLILIILPIIAALVVIQAKYEKNITSITPYPYYFTKNAYKDIDPKAPILIIGDRMGKRFSNYSQIMAEKISENLKRPIKIVSIAEDGEGIHRTYQKVKSLNQLPLITIFLGGGQEHYESRFHTKDMRKIASNLSRMNDEVFQTMMMIYPPISRIIYSNVKYKVFSEKIEEDSESYYDRILLKRRILSFKLYEKQLYDLFSYIREHNSYLIAMSYPINLDVLPKRSCADSLDEISKIKYDEIMKLIESKDYKGAYEGSKLLTSMASGNAKAHYLRGKISKSLGHLEEAKQQLELSAIYDCTPWRASPVYSHIMSRVAQQTGVMTYDFQKLLYKDWTKNILFSDHIYPQDLYLEKASLHIAKKIKKILKL